MPFTGNEDFTISLTDAGNQNKTFRSKNPTQTKAVYMSRYMLEQFLANPDHVGIRVYIGQDSDSKFTMNFCAVLENEDDVLDLVAGDAYRCPVKCGNNNALNS